MPFSYLHILVAGNLFFHIFSMSTTKSFFLFPVYEGPVVYSLSLDDSSHELFLVHRCTDDFQVVCVDDDLAKVYNWGRLEKDLISVSPAQIHSTTTGGPQASRPSPPPGHGCSWHCCMTPLPTTQSREQDRAQRDGLRIGPGLWSGLRNLT